MRGDDYAEMEAAMSIFPTKILLATDSSQESNLALSTAIDLAKSTNSQLHVVTVAPSNPDPAYALHEAAYGLENYEQASEAIGKEAQEILDNQVRKIEEAGGTVQEAYSTDISSPTVCHLPRV
jgi:nucleotide-binding universal stress UspA family protein